MIAALAIVGGYAALIWSTGWLGVAAVVAHVVLMCLFMPRGGGKP